MNDLWNALATQAAAHLIEIEAALAALSISFIFSMPEQVPHCLRFIDPAIWTWVRDTLQGAVPMKFQKTIHVNPTNPAQPGKE